MYRSGEAVAVCSTTSTLLGRPERVADLRTSGKSAGSVRLHNPLLPVRCSPDALQNLSYPHLCRWGMPLSTANWR